MTMSPNCRDAKCAGVREADVIVNDFRAARSRWRPARLVFACRRMRGGPRYDRVIGDGTRPGYPWPRGEGAMTAVSGFIGLNVILTSRSNGCPAKSIRQDLEHVGRRDPRRRHIVDLHRPPSGSRGLESAGFRDGLRNVDLADLKRHTLGLS